MKDLPLGVRTDPKEGQYCLCLPTVVPEARHHPAGALFFFTAKPSSQLGKTSFSRHMQAYLDAIRTELSSDITVQLRSLSPYPRRGHQLPPPLSRGPVFSRCPLFTCRRIYRELSSANGRSQLSSRRPVWSAAAAPSSRPP